MKTTAKQPFLYRHRLVIGYAVLLLVFAALLVLLPHIAPGGLSKYEMESAVASSQLFTEQSTASNIINLPYRALQKASIFIFGLTLYSVKIPSIIIAILAALFIVLLLNRWFKNDVAITGSILTVLSTAFLFLAGNGTPTIMYVFWLALILWLGSKIVGNRHTHPLLVISFFLTIALSLYTPHMCYVAAAIGITGLMHPHLRCSLKQIKLWQLIISFVVFAITVAPLIATCIFSPSVIQNLAFMPDFNIGGYVSNIANAFAPFFSFGAAYDSIYLAPLFGIATVALIVIGILASLGSLFTSRNTIASLLVIFSIIFSGLNPDIAISIIIPISILVAAGLESILNRWFSLFPENPYAHFIGLVPIAILVIVIISSGLLQFIYGYHYVPRVAENFNDDISIIQQNLTPGTVLVISKENPSFDFYKLLEQNDGYTIMSEAPERIEVPIAFLGGPSPVREDLELKQIITSPKSRNSDRLYIYEKVVKANDAIEEQGE